MFVGQLTKVVDYEGYRVTIRKLSAKSLDKARNLRQEDDMVRVSKLGPAIVKAFLDDDDGKSDKRVKVERVRGKYANYDRFSILLSGIAEWEAVDGTDLPPVGEGIDQLDEPAVDFLFKEIIDFSVPDEDARSKA